MDNFDDYYMPRENFASKMAHSILDMEGELFRLRCEVERLREYEQKYHELLGESVAHGQQMVGSILGLLLSDNVTIKTPK